MFKGDKKAGSMIVFGGEVKLSAPCRKIYGILKNTASKKEILRRKHSMAISRKIFPASLLHVSAGEVIATDLWWKNQK
jgi:hypothetical protein